MPPDDVRSAYDDVADWYDAWVRRSLIHRELILPGMLDLCGDVHGRDILDLACGQGVVTRELLRAGARAHGVDASAALISLARAEAGIGHASYSVDDAQTLGSLDDDSFDGATCSMGLGDIPDLDAVLAATHRVLRADGWFVFAITHPCFQSPHARWQEDGPRSVRVIERYGHEGWWASRDPRGVRGKVGAVHRTVSTIVRALVEAGFHLDRLEEPLAAGGLAASMPGYREIPPLLMVRASRA